MPDHLLHLDAVDEYGPCWRLTCEHPEGAPWEIECDCDCWFMTWWQGVGAELIDLKAPKSFPIPVRPSDLWDDDYGGSVVYDEKAVIEDE